MSARVLGGYLLKHAASGSIGQPGYSDKGSEIRDLEDWIDSNVGQGVREIMGLGGRDITRKKGERDRKEEQIKGRQQERFTVVLGSVGGDEISELDVTSGEIMCEGKVSGIVRATAQGWYQTTYKVNIGGGRGDYEPGDVVRVMPRNRGERVERILELMRSSGRFDHVLDPNVTLTVALKGNGGTKVGGVGGGLTGPPATVREILEERADLGYTGVDVNVLHALSHYVDLGAGEGKGGGESQYDKLRSMSGGEGEALYRDYVVKEKRGLPDVLTEFDAVWGEGGITVEGLLEVLREMRPREFSIASGPEDTRETGKVEILAAVKRGTTRLGRKYVGGCSDYFEGLAGGLDGDEGEGQKAQWAVAPFKFSIRGGEFGRVLHLLPQGAPLMCVGAGTGIAPLRSALRSRAASRGAGGKGGGGDVLVQGFRREGMDDYYSGEWEGLGVEVWKAESQRGVRKIYVQDVIRERGVEVADIILRRKGALLIAGGAKMATAVAEEVARILGEKIGAGKDSKKVGRKLLEALRKKGRYSMESWT
ncbi:hypothetical protein TrCOL_g4354 [Triparma columacea]|uniref:FAD-binding FR-type domain-containing protein n=1 Tax=Triparma columacea TaxID=722753 RepID=A0A9W7G086_9STRA|nr:hypothetical protein TrCOL_g4354 [Triparma columacea]